MSIAVAFLNSKEFSRLLMKGKDQTFLTPEEINDAIPTSIMDIASVELIMEKIDEARIFVKTPDVEEEEADKTTAAETADDALSLAEENELRTSSSDPVKLYLKKMGSVALLTREGEVKIAKEIEEGEKEIILSCLSSKHALEETAKLRQKINQAELQNEYVKDLVRGLDDESTEKEIIDVRDRIFKVVDHVEELLKVIINEDGTLKKFSKDERALMDKVGNELVDLTFNRKIINSLTEPVKNFRS